MGSMQVLIVTDNDAEADVLSRTVAAGLPGSRIERIDCLTDTCHAIASAHYDAVLFDLSLSGNRGLSIVRQLVAHDHVAVIVLVGSNDSELARQALHVGAQDYWPKGELDSRLVPRCIQYAVERRRSDCALRAQDERLLQKHRMEALGELAGGVAHEFNNLLQIIQTYGSFASEGLDPEDQRRKDLQEVANAAERAVRLTAQLLGFSRRRSLRRCTVRTNDVINDLIQMLRPLLGEHIHVTQSFDEVAGYLQVDTALFEQMLTNICLNARDAMPHGGELKISTEAVSLTEDCPGCFRDLGPGSYVAISVTDDGCGMPPDVAAMVFEPFFTTKDVGKGTGLGLSMAYGVVKQHGGTINVYSEPGLGTTIRIFLPSTADVSESLRPAAVDYEVSSGQEVILIAEDEPGVQKAAQRILERAGYSTICASDGEEAIRLFERHASEISAVILDAIMPKLLGRHVYEAIRYMRPDTPVLFCTGFDKDTGLFDFVDREGLPVLSKPFQPAPLLKALREMIDGAEQSYRPIGVRIPDDHLRQIPYFMTAQ